MGLWNFAKHYFASIGDNFGMLNKYIYRGAVPDLQRLKVLQEQFGIKAVLDLRDNNTIQESLECDELKILYYGLSMSDTKEPTPETFNNALAVIHMCRKAGEPVYVHCEGGRHRTGALCFCYRVDVDEWTPQDAYYEMVHIYHFYPEFGHKPLKTALEKRYNVTLK